MAGDPRECGARLLGAEDRNKNGERQDEPRRPGAPGVYGAEQAVPAAQRSGVKPDGEP